ncbi:hypothetical protein RQ479_06195 [Mesorhizobium sp. ISC25]|uniref:hypothetical protein n=1 Tax=Mesorhizobium sp. ISC25 TaxID=3077335 RepID=UPI0035D7DA86
MTDKNTKKLGLFARISHAHLEARAFDFRPLNWRKNREFYRQLYEKHELVRPLNICVWVGMAVWVAFVIWTVVHGGM